jgi:hypothetical protein
MWITQTQLPITPAFALIEYKAQSTTYESAILNLSWNSQASGEDASHKRFCSTNTQISHLKTMYSV